MPKTRPKPRRRPVLQRSPALILWLCWASLCLWLPAQAQLPIEIQDPDPSTPWHLSADRIVTQQDLELAEAWGSVLLTKEGSTLQAEYARYYWDTQWVYLEGDVKAHWGGDYLEAEQAEFDLKNEVGWLQEGIIRVQDPSLIFEGERLEKTGPGTYSFETATVTSCEGSPPDWSIRAGQGKITLDGYASLRSTSFLVRDQPVLYSPYLVVPVKTRRQSGFLIPEFSASSRLGTGVNLPYYHVLDEENDLTLYLNGMSDRGLMLGAEFRHTPTLDSKGWWRADWLSDRESASTEKEEDDQFDDDGLVRPNHDRYWIRSKFNAYLPHSRWETKLDLDWVSDQNYLREFDNGLSGFEDSRDTLLEEFGRDIDDKDDLTRTSVWTLARNWTNFGFQSRVEYGQNLRYRNDNLDSGDDPTLQRLPELNFNFYKSRLATSPFEWEARNELTYFWRRRGTTGVRLDLHPRLSLPLTSSYGTIIPTVGWRQTLYAIDRFQDAPANVDEDDSYLDRGLLDFQVQAFSEAFRVFDLSPSPEPGESTLGQSRWTRLKHSIRPEVEYSYIPDQRQSDLPFFDRVDRIEPRDMVTACLTNVLTWRRDSVVPLAAADDQYGLKTDYLDFLRVRLEQSYDFREDDRDRDLDRFPARPFSELLLEVRVKPTPWFSLWNRTWYSHYEGTVTEHEHFLRFTLPERGFAYFGLDYRSDAVENDIWRRRRLEEFAAEPIDLDPLSVFRIGGELALSPAWTVRASYHRDLEEDENIATTFGLTYASQCWSVDALLDASPDENRIEFRLNLLELGSLGSSVRADLE